LTKPGCTEASCWRGGRAGRQHFDGGHLTLASASEEPGVALSPSLAFLACRLLMFTSLLRLAVSQKKLSSTTDRAIVRRSCALAREELSRRHRRDSLATVDWEAHSRLRRSPRPLSKANQLDIRDRGALRGACLPIVSPKYPILGVRGSTESRTSIGKLPCQFRGILLGTARTCRGRGNANNDPTRPSRTERAALAKTSP
jgi:hypothetical protein